MNTRPSSAGFPANFPDAPLAAQGYAEHQASNNSRKKRKRVPSSEQNTPNWSDFILRIRDARDEAAFSDLFNHFAPRVKGFLINSGAEASQAEEWAQDVMATVWTKAQQFDPTRASAATWIYTIARNKRIDGLRKQNRPEPNDLLWGPEPDIAAADAMVLQEETEKLTTAVEHLPKKQRELVMRAFYGELSHAELAQETGLPLGTIKSRIRLALERLRRAMS